MEDLGDDLGPPVQEVCPSALNVQVAGLRPRMCLVEKDQVATAVEVPSESTLGERPGAVERRAGSVLAETCRGDDEGARGQSIHDAVVVGWLWGQHIRKLGIRIELRVALLAPLELL